MAVKFSQRTGWQREPNRLTALLEARRRGGNPVYDLTASNPTECGIRYPEQDITTALSNPRTLQYQPDPRGLLGARETISRYYHSKGINAEPSRMFLTAGTSEAYAILFKLLCDPGEEILVPRPSYPLFDHLARLHDIKLTPYSLMYDHEWRIDFDSLRQAITPAAKGLVIVHPHNPTGMFLNQSAYRMVKEIAAGHSIALIVDEVFIDFPLDPNQSVVSTAGERDLLTFTLNGISKMAGLPQLKLGWMVVGGPTTATDEAVGRLEILCDTFLSVNTPVQVALPEILKAGERIRESILARIRSNYAYVRQTITKNSSCTPLNCEGGWSAIIRVPRVRPDEELALDLLEKKGIYLYPGYFFDFETEGHLVVSLLAEEGVFRRAIDDLVRSLG